MVLLVPNPGHGSFHFYRRLFTCLGLDVTTIASCCCCGCFLLGFHYSEKTARLVAEAKAEEGSKVVKEKEAAVGRVDHLTRQTEAQADSYDALVRPMSKSRNFGVPSAPFFSVSLLSVLSRLKRRVSVAAALTVLTSQQRSVYPPILPMVMMRHIMCTE